ncbi:MAG: endonuclease/exonuclease/phosphatase family protein, partial [Ignavibacteria bacterium]|nr:endonuclease/exonuclease/phosphatase family protein [Ignavibacteria bacterium]
KEFEEGDGSLMHNFKLELIDQIIISRALLDKQKLDYDCDSFEVYKNPLMVTKTGKWAGSPRPTFSGPRYLDGYSDHFPVIAKFKILN